MLSAVLPSCIQEVIKKLVMMGDCIYLSESIGGGSVKKSNNWFTHDYDRLMMMHGMEIIDGGMIVDGQPWKLYKKQNRVNSGVSVR